MTFVGIGLLPGPNKIVDSFNCTLKVDELTILYGDNMGICYGSSDEHFKLTTGKELEVKGRWTATLVKDDGHWLVASLHASTNLFDNVMLDFAKKAAKIVGVIGLILGLVAGWFLGRRRKPAACVRCRRWRRRSPGSVTGPAASSWGSWRSAWAYAGPCSSER